MNDKNKLLFTDFHPISKQEWMERVHIDLKGADFDRKLVWKNLSKINIQPFYNVDDKQDYLINTGENSPSLINYRSIEVQSDTLGNKLALQAIKEGINGLLFDIKEISSPAELLDGINLNEITVSFILRTNEVPFASDFFTFIEKNSINNKNLKGYFDLDIISNYLTTGKLGTGKFEKAAALAELAKEYPNFKAITVSGVVYLDSGANQVQEVAYTLNSLVYLIEKYAEKGILIQTIFDNLNFQLAIGSEYFVEIGKFRAFHSLLQEIAKKYGISEFSYTLTAKTSIWSKSVIDAHTNLLRATTEAMSAMLGNVDGLLIDAYDSEFNEVSDFSNRISGNISTILKEESYFGKVANPVDGSYYIEEISTKIGGKALALFKAIEENGGFYTSFENETIQIQIGEIRLEKIKLLSQRRLSMVGVNKYPNLMENISENLLFEGTKTSTNTKFLKPRRASLEIEALRRTTESLVAKTEVRPVVGLVSFGNLTMRKARAAFAYDFIGVSGYKILSEQSYDSAQIAAEKSAISESNVVVICSSDQDYEASAVTFVKTFRAINTNKVLLLAGNPINLIDDLTEAGLDGCIHIKSDIITTISNIQHKIQKTVKPQEV